MVCRALAHHVKQVRTGPKRTHHAGCGLVEHLVGDMVEQMALELEVDDEINMGLVPNRRERPSVVQVLKWPVDSLDFYQSWSIQSNLAPESFVKRAKADGEVSGDLLQILLKNLRAGAPRHERRIILYVGH